jgi:hypothetical protein
MQPKRDFGPEIRKLPRGKPLTKRQLLRPGLRLESSGQIRVYYAPVDYVNRKAKIVLAGITPGWTQMELIYRTAVEHWDTLSPRAISRKVKQAGAFAGSMRTLLVDQLDGIGVNRFLGVESTSALFDSASHLLHATSVLRYPVFVDGENYTGHKPALLRTPLFAPYIDDFAREVERVERALIVPLGKAVSGVLEHLVAEERIDKRRCLIGFPHPSGANALRTRHFAERRRSLRRRVKRWADTGS